MVLMQTVRLLSAGAIVVVAVFVMTSLGVGLPAPTHGAGASRELTEDQEKLVAAKAAAKAAAGIVDKTMSPTAPVITDEQPSNNYTIQLHLTREELVARIDASTEAAEGKWRELEGTIGRSQAHQAKARFLEQQEELKKAVPTGGRDISINMAHVGTHSINFSATSYGDSGSPSDPVSAAFYVNGSHIDVEYDLRNWTSIEWEDADGGVCGDPLQSVWLNEVDHGGINTWYYHDDTWQPDYDTCASDERDHMRFWEAKTYDAYHGYGDWSVATPHREHHPVYVCVGPWWAQSCYWDFTTHKVTSWHDGRDTVEKSFREGASLGGLPLWFVGAIYKQTIASPGNYNGTTWDGKAVFIRLEY